MSLQEITNKHQLRLKQNVVPHIFNCQQDNNIVNLDEDIPETNEVPQLRIESVYTLSEDVIEIESDCEIVEDNCKLYEEVQTTKEDELSHCKLCQKFYMTSEEYNTHLYKHIDKGLCDICKQVVADPKEHIKGHYERTLRTCRICKRATIIYVNNVMQMRAHCGKNLLRCKICLVTFMDEQHILSHIQTHKTCTICNRVFKDNCALKSHARTHENLDEFIVTQIHECKICKELFTYTKDLAIHMKTHEDLQQCETCYLCDKCDTSYKNENILKTHLENKHCLIKLNSVGGILYECNICMISCNSKEDLMKHMDIHTKSMLHFCKTCNIGYAYLDQLEEHRKNKH